MRTTFGFGCKMSSGAYTAAREPKNADEWSTLQDLSDILTWAGLAGSTDYGPSPQGSLLASLGADSMTTVEEFGAIEIDDFSTAVDKVWLHSESVNLEDFRSTELTITPSAIMKMRARSAHHTARIWSGIDFTRNTKRQKLDEQEAKMQQYRDSKLAAMQGMTSNLGANGAAASSTGESVPINEIADTM